MESRVIIGTAGHIDHGKTALVRALTGVDTDRLPEEKRRGITIELGFAPLELEGIGRVGIVDVPGHEGFVRTMVAGATGIDLALLVVAADEGAMPQTREHLAILSLLGVRTGVISVTKRDLVDREWLGLVVEDLRGHTAGTPLAAAPIIATSAQTGEGLRELRHTLSAALRALPPRASDDLFRMPVDRAFTVRGTGTVVTGTVWTGSLRRDQSVRVLPAGITARIRGLQTHGVSVAEASVGTRSAIALAGVELDRVGRGSVLVTDPEWAPTRVLRAEVSLLPSAPAPIRIRTRVRFHLGTSEVGARIVTRQGTLEPGGHDAARVVLDETVVARGWDPFVLRGVSPLTTIGGGVVTDPLPPARRARLWPAGAPSPAVRLALLLAEAGAQGVERGNLALRLGVRPAELGGMLESGDGAPAFVLGGRVYASAARAALEAELLALVDDHHRRWPLEPGAPLQAIRARLSGAPELVEAVIRAHCESGELAAGEGLIRRAEWTPQVSASQAATMAALGASLERAGREPPSLAELAAVHGPAVGPLLRLLEREGRVVQVEEDRYYDAAALEGVVAALRDGMEPGREYSPAELRDLLGVSRKYLIPILEFCDRRGVTIRYDAGRRRGGT